jgi:hypothetical protein
VQRYGQQKALKKKGMTPRNIISNKNERNKTE